MVIKEFEGKRPVISPKAYIAELAVVVGDVIMEDYSSLWHHCSVRGDVNQIRIGQYSNVQDNAVLHVADDYPCIIKDYVTVGHGAIIHGCIIEDHCLIGMGAIILNGAVIGRGSIVAAGAVVRESMAVPENSLVAGVPARIVKQLPDRLPMIHAQAVKYKDLWSRRYGVNRQVGGEDYHGQEII